MRLHEMYEEKPEINTLSALCEHLPDAVVLTDLEGLIVSANAQAEKIFGYGIGEIVGREVEALLPDRFRDVHRSHRLHYYERFPVRPMGTGLELTARKKDGSEFPAEISLGPLNIGKGTLVISVIRDITERKRLESAIIESEERYRSLVELSPEAIVVHSEGTMLYANDAAARLLLAQSAQDLVGKSLLEYVPQEYKSIVIERMRGLLVTGQRQEPLLIRSLRADGQEFILEAIASRINFRGKMGSQVILRDITDRVRADEELRDSREQLRSLSTYLQSAREEERTSIAREIHDELGGALTALKLDLSALEETLAETPGQDRRISLNEKVDSMNQLIDDTIRTMRRIATDLRPVILDSLGLNAAIEWQAEEFQRRTGIRCEVMGTDQENNIDQNRSTAVFRIFQETLTNVARHSGANRVDVNLRVKESILFLDVRDNGKGISETQAKHSRSFGLLGMRERALLFGGQITISGRPGEGTAVALTMPLR